jgi:RNA polymerase sigma factor (sigma-70 family)
MTALSDDDDDQADRDSAVEIALIQAARTGDRVAFGVLYERYEPMAYRFACKMLGTVQGADDLVAEAFAKVFERIVSGGGPTTAFRAYLLTTVRTTWYKQLAGDRMIDRQVDLSDLSVVSLERDLLEDRLDVALAAGAFASLPERWQTVLWYLQVENESTATVAERLGIAPNAIAALAFRARDALRIAYLQMHVKTDVDVACRESAGNLAAWLCGRLNRGLRIRIEKHIAGCPQCRASAVEVRDLMTQIRRMVPLTLGRSTPVLLPDDVPPPDESDDLKRPQGLVALNSMAVAAVVLSVVQKDLAHSSTLADLWSVWGSLVNASLPF